MDKSEIFTYAHLMAKDYNKKGDCYAVTFAACLKIIYAGLKSAITHTLEYSESEIKQVKSGARAMEVVIGSYFDMFLQSVSEYFVLIDKDGGISDIRRITGRGHAFAKDSNREIRRQYVYFEYM